MERTREAIVGWVRARKGRAVMAEFERETGIGKKTVYRLFAGGWGAVLAEAGRVEGTRRVDAKEVVARLARLEKELGRGVTWNELAKRGRGADEQGSPGTPPPASQTRPPPPPAAGEGAHAPAAGEGATGEQGKREQYGRPLVAGAVVCEPVNELGVVCLFGAMAAELGFYVMRVRGEFPDCEALRRVEVGRWERVRVEFEYRSGNFARHGHDARGCDVIVCWENDWEGCPIEVVALKGEMGRKKGAGQPGT